ncbi:MAG: sodium:solute symporter family protein [Gammaproteobacteria bacterium]|nr:sodium:solute symporter family protein [Pseudomonadales bacterium]MCP5345397.1 sodium:solute symporter family protein [Pseudomonadales bacterium]
MDSSAIISTAVIVIYLLGFTVFGILLNRRNRSSDDWATGSSTLGLWMLAAGVAGTRIGGAGTYGVAGDVVTGGLGNLWYGVNSFAALALVGIFFAIPYRRLRLSSAGQVFDLRFGSRRCQWLSSLCVQTEYLIVNIIEPFVIGSIVSGVTGLPFGLCVFIGGIVIFTFTATGGLKGTGITNIIHCAITIGGLALVGLVAMQNMGGWSSMMDRADAMLVENNIPQQSWWSFTGIGWASIIALFFSATLHTPAASVYCNYSTSARHENLLLPGFVLAGAMAAVMPFLAGFIGIGTLAEYGPESGLSSYRNITQLATDVGPIIGGVALAAILGALISSGAPILLGSATLFVNDWIPGSKNFSQEKRLRAYKVTTVVYGLVATTIAWKADISSVLQLLLLGFAMVVPPAIAIGYIFYWKGTTERGVFWGMVTGYGGGLLHWLLNTLFEGAENADVGGFAQLWYEFCQFLGEWRDPTFAATLIPLVVIPLVSLLVPGRGEDHQSDSFYTALKSARA